MSKTWKKLTSGLVGLALLAAVFAPIAAFAFTQTVDRLGTGTTPTPVVTSCGTSPTITGSDFAGLVTVGTGTPTTCTITFSATFSGIPVCVVNSATQLAAFSYTVSATAIAVTQTATSSNLIRYICVGQ
jgi:hypothetical protein